jgi:two-component system chemotaxis response regulator CheY
MAKILVVDDSGMTRRMLRRILETEGHQVLEAQDGLAALEQYFLDKPDLVLLDLTMPEVHGLEVLEKLRQMDREACVIVATADIQRATHEEAVAAGAIGYVTKPLKDAAVLEAVNRALKGEEES